MNVCTNEPKDDLQNQPKCRFTHFRMPFRRMGAILRVRSREKV